MGIDNLTVIIGLSLNFVGTLLVAFSIKKGEVEMMQEKSKNPEWETTIKYRPKRFWTGISILAFGFLIQIAGVVIN
ncbi:hypothetical protein ACFLT2_01335 [Acidobacteriota bacterium]